MLTVLSADRNPDPFVTVKQHIKLLHDYNEIRDVGMGLMGIIADNRNMRVRDVYAEFGVGEDD
jgi:DNA repair protein Swi5/Sae3